MKNYRVCYSIRDGEYEYMQYLLIQARNEQSAINKAQKEANLWIKYDYRVATGFSAKEMTQQEYEIVKNFIY